MIFKKRKRSQNKIRPSSRKRKVLTTVALILNLLFGKPRLSFSRSSSPNFDNQAVQERVIEEREFNLLEENDRQIILAKAEGNPITPPTNRGPSHLPTPPSGGQPSRPVTGVNPYRVPPKVVNQGLGAGANPAGAGGAAEFDDNSPVPKKEQSQELKTFDYEYRSNDPKNKKQSKDQCELNENTPREINEKFESKGKTRI
jgi:hypothetical protein